MGSRVDIYLLGEKVEPTVKAGDKVRANLDTIAVLKDKPSEMQTDDESYENDVQGGDSE